MSVKTFCLNCGGFIEGDEIVMGVRGFVCKACFGKENAERAGYERERLLDPWEPAEDTR